MKLSDTYIERLKPFDSVLTAMNQKRYTSYPGSEQKKQLMSIYMDILNMKKKPCNCNGDLWLRKLSKWYIENKNLSQ